MFFMYRYFKLIFSVAYFFCISPSRKLLSQKKSRGIFLIKLVFVLLTNITLFFVAFTYETSPGRHSYGEMLTTTQMLIFLVMRVRICICFLCQLVSVLYTNSIMNIMSLLLERKFDLFKSNTASEICTVIAAKTVVGASLVGNVVSKWMSEKTPAGVVWFYTTSVMMISLDYFGVFLEMVRMNLVLINKDLTYCIESTIRTQNGYNKMNFIKKLRRCSEHYQKCYKAFKLINQFYQAPLLLILMHLFLRIVSIFYILSGTLVIDQFISIRLLSGSLIILIPVYSCLYCLKQITSEVTNMVNCIHGIQLKKVDCEIHNEEISSAVFYAVVLYQMTS